MSRYDLKPMILAEAIMEFFQEDKGGYAANFAFYELCQYCNDFLNNGLPKEKLVDYLGFTFGYSGDEFDAVFEKYEKALKDLEPMGVL